MREHFAVKTATVDMLIALTYAVPLCDVPPSTEALLSWDSRICTLAAVDPSVHQMVSD